jgi:menaquinone-dependent protoporphyrinogen oxidase
MRLARGGHRLRTPNLGALAGRPVWLFSVGLARALGGWAEAHAKEPKEIAGFRDAIHPRDHRLLAGAIERDHIPLIGRLI